MAEPKQKTPSKRSRSRRAVLKIAEKHLVLCKNCKSPIPPHTVCPECGKYKGREIIKTLIDITADSENSGILHWYPGNIERGIYLFQIKID